MERVGERQSAQKIVVHSSERHDKEYRSCTQNDKAHLNGSRGK